MNRYKVRSRVLFDVEHVVDARDIEHARSKAAAAAEDIACRLAVRDACNDLGLRSERRASPVIYSAEDGLVVSALDKREVECLVPDDPSPGMEHIVAFRRLDGEHFDLRLSMALKDRLKAAGFSVLGQWSAGPSVTTFRLDRPASLLSFTIRQKLCASFRHDHDADPLEVE